MKRCRHRKVLQLMNCGLWCTECGAYTSGHFLDKNGQITQGSDTVPTTRRVTYGRKWKYPTRMKKNKRPRRDKNRGTRRAKKVVVGKKPALSLSANNALY
jgi:hypothetical protein